MKDLFDRIAFALDAGEIPAVEDAVNLEQLVMRYWEKEQDLHELGLVSRVSNKATDITKLDKTSVQSLVNHLVKQQLPEDGKVFAELLRCYIDGRITASDLFGERERKPRNGQGWQHYDQLGEQVEQVHQQIIDPKTDKHILHTSNRSISNGLHINLYNLLSDLSQPRADLTKIKAQYSIPSKCEITLIDTGFLSPSQWRDCHQEFKKHF